MPVAHIQLLAGQTKHSDAGGDVKNDYYVFKAVHRTNGNKEISQCGMGAAGDFLKLLKHEGLPIFNPLHGERGAGGHGNGDPQGEEEGGGRRNPEWDKVARQLYNAIMWVIIIINARVDTPIFEIREEVYNRRGKVPYKSQVKGVNTIIRKNMRGRTLTEAIDELRQYNVLRNELCQFNKLVDMINGETDKEGNPLQSYF